MRKKERKFYMKTLMVHKKQPLKQEDNKGKKENCDNL